MPLFEEYRESLKSEIADMLNSPGRPARRHHRCDVPEGVRRDHAVGASRHRRHGVGRRRAAVERVKGATGVMIRTLVEVARTAGSNWP